MCAVYVVAVATVYLCNDHDKDDTWCGDDDIVHMAVMMTHLRMTVTITTHANDKSPNQSLTHPSFSHKSQLPMATTTTASDVKAIPTLTMDDEDDPHVPVLTLEEVKAHMVILLKPMSAQLAQLSTTVHSLSTELKSKSSELDAVRTQMADLQRDNRAKQIEIASLQSWLIDLETTGKLGAELQLGLTERDVIIPSPNLKSTSTPTDAATDTSSSSSTTTVTSGKDNLKEVIWTLPVLGKSGEIIEDLAAANSAAKPCPPLLSAEEFSLLKAKLQMADARIDKYLTEATIASVCHTLTSRHYQL